MRIESYYFIELLMTHALRTHQADGWLVLVNICGGCLVGGDGGVVQQHWH